MPGQAPKEESEIDSSPPSASCNCPKARAAKMKGMFIVAAKRTPFGKLGGKLKDTTITDMQGQVFKAALAAGKVDPKQIDTVHVGNVISASAEDGVYLARHAALHAGIPFDRVAITINRLCASGFQSIVNAVHDITMGDAKVVLTGGVESLSGAPFIVRDRFGGPHTKEDTINTTLTDIYIHMGLGEVAENTAALFKCTKEEVDKFALASHTNWKKGQDAGAFKAELAPVKAKDGKVLDHDENPNPSLKIEDFSKEKAAKAGGVVTGMTTCGLCDGAGAVIVASEAAVKQFGYKPIARIVSYGIAAVDPKAAGLHGAVPACQKALKAAGLTLDKMDLIEINEAFAGQALAAAKDLKCDMSKVNQHGGGVAIGHALAASGQRITAHLCHELQRQGKHYAIGCTPAAGGQGIAIILEKV